MKILVGVCTGGTVHTQTVASLVAALAQIREAGISYSLSLQIGGDKPHAMNRLAREAMEGGYDRLMSIDNDMIFPHNGILALLSDNDKDIIGANYAERGNSVTGATNRCVVKIADENGQKIETTIDKLPKEVFECYSLGNGFTLYKTEIFRKIPAPWFENKEDADGGWSTEDVLIAEKAREAGFKVWCNPLLDIGHIGTTDYRLHFQ